MKYQVKVNGKVVNAYDFEWNDDISLWQAIVLCVLLPFFKDED